MSEKLTMHQRFAACLDEIGPTLGKTADNPFFKSKYIPLPELLEKVVPILRQHGFYLTYPHGESCSDTKIVVSAAVVDEETGEKVAESVLEMPLMQDPQKNTQNCTYGRRSVTTSVLCIAEKDDDGNSAAAPRPRATSDAKSGERIKGLW